MLMPEEVPSPMDLNPTLEVSAALIADCDHHADRYRLTTPARGEPILLDESMRQIALGAVGRRPRLDTA